MDLEQLKRRQSLKVVISEAIMVIAVILMVTILAFIVSGYWVNSDFQIERQGLLQLSSTPSGASIEIDGGSSWLQKTNASKVLSSGEHKIKLTKEGYDSWEKKITISEGLLYRLNYPRLFSDDRYPEEVFQTVGTTAASVSQNHETMLLMDGTTVWSLINLNSDTIEAKKIDISNYFSAVSIAKGAKIGLFTGHIFNYEWDRDGSHILFKVSDGENIEWVLIDVKNVENSINLTKSFGYGFEDVKIINNSASELLATQSRSLHKINTSNRSISSVLIDGVIDFNHFDNEVVFCAQNETADGYYVGVLNLGNNKVTSLKETTLPAKVANSRFYDDKVVVVQIDNMVSVYEKDDYSKLSSFTLSFIPGTIKIGHGGEFIVLYSDTNLATIDMESLKLSEWQVEGSKFGWLDSYMVYTVADGNLIVYDYDGLNRRELSKGVSTRLPATITNNKWLYYFNDNSLIRESLIPR